MVNRFNQNKLNSKFNMNENDIKKLIQEIEATKPLKLRIKGSTGLEPRAIRYYSSKKQFVPDIVAEFENKRDFYSIEKDLKNDDISLLTFKWILFSAEARMKSGKYFLVIDKSQKELCNKVIKEKMLDIELIIF